MMIYKFIKKIIHFFKKPGFWTIALILITSIVFIPALKIEFWWVDDGWDIFISQKILNSVAHFNLDWINIIFNESGGRFRAGYWIYQSLEYFIGGNNPALHFFVHYLVILGAALLIFGIVFRLTKSGLLGFFSSIFYILTPLNTENLFRLGPQEPLLGLFLAGSMYYLLKNKIYLSILFLLFAILTKENGFVLWIPVLFYYSAKRIVLKIRDKSLEKYTLWGLIFTIPVILNTLLRRGGYSGFYSFEIDKITSHFMSYISLINEALSPLLAIFVTTFLFRSFVIFRNGKYRKYRQDLLYEAMFLILFLALVVVQSPWAFVLNRYVMPATVGLVIFMAMEVSGIKNYLVEINKNKILPWLIAIFAVYIVSFLWMNGTHVFLSGELSAHQTSFVQSLYESLAKEVPQGGIVLLNFHEGDSTKELVVETAMHLDLLYQRSDIKVDYLNLDNLPKTNYMIVGTPQVVEQYTQKQIEKSVRYGQKDESLAKKDRYLVLTTPMNLFKQIVKKTYQLFVHQTPFTSDGIYTYYISQDYWYKYYVGI